MIYKIKLRSEVFLGHWQHCWWLGGVDGVGSGEVGSGWVGGVGGVGSGAAPHWVRLGDPVLRTFYLK